MSLAELLDVKAFTGGEIDEAMRPNLALHGLTMEQGRRLPKNIVTNISVTWSYILSRAGY